EHALEPVQAGGARQEVLRDLEPELTADERVGVDEPVERDVDRPLGLVFTGTTAEVGASPLDVLEYLDDGLRRPIAHRGAEAPERGLVRERRLGAEVGDSQRRLEGPARREDLAPDGVDGRSRERAYAGLAQAPEDLGFPLRGIDRRILPSFEVSDLEGGLGALVEELENSVVEFVDPGAPIVQVHRDSHYCRALGVPRIIGRCPIRGQVGVRGPQSGSASPRQVETAKRRALTSFAVNGRDSPGRKAPSATGPNAM